MKKLILLLIVFIFSNAQSQWTYLSTIQGSPNINSISVVNQNLIWVCCDTTRVYRSTNGGVNWVLRNGGIPAGNLYGISAIDSLNCWIGTVAGSIYRTSDGGLNWVNQFSISNSFSDGIKMFSLNYGIYMGDPTATSGQPFQFRYTTNGGTNWLLSPNSSIGNSEYGLVNAWDWIDTGTVWIGIANAVANASSSKVFKCSGFGGGNWSSTILNGTGTADGLYYQGVAFTDANNGMVGSNNGNFRKTTNGGVNWSLVTNPPGITSFSVNDMEGFKNGSNLIRVATLTSGPTNRCFTTTNLGATWTEETLPALGIVSGISHMDYVNPSLGFSGGKGGLVMRFGNPSGISSIVSEVAEDYNLDQNFPNPFNPVTKINFSIPKSSQVTLKVYDALGKEITTLVNDFKQAGSYSYDFNASVNLTSGIYFYTLISENFTATKKMLLLK